jgi:hypothetical protein
MVHTQITTTYIRFDINTQQYFQNILLSMTRDGLKLAKLYETAGPPH